MNKFSQRAYVLTAIIITSAAAISLGLYYVKTRLNTKIKLNRSITGHTQNQLAPSQLQGYSPAASKEETWRTEIFRINRETAVSGRESINLSILSPSDWTIKTIRTDPNKQSFTNACQDYVIENPDLKAKLMISINVSCKGWTDAYYDWPQGAVVIKQENNVGDDGHTAYIVRYLDPAENQYRYVEGLKEPNNKIRDGIFIRYNPSTGNFMPTQITLDYTGQNRESIIETTDKIVMSLSANIAVSN